MAAPSGVVFTDPACLAYHTPGHPEAPDRVSRTAERLAAAGYELRRPERGREEWIALVHTPEHWASIRAGTYRDADTPVYRDMADLALISLGGAVAAMESGAEGRPAFSLMRPPGHHAGRDRVAGFCYVNNMAVCVAKALADGRAKRAAIVDVDVHHGDGTEDIAKGRPGWLFVSLHQVPLYPGTGLVSDDNCLNYPLGAGTAGPEYLEALREALEPVRAFEPDLVAVSAGFDTYKRCPIAGLELDDGDYREIGRLLSAFPRRFALLEGGYAPELPVLVQNFLEGFFA